MSPTGRRVIAFVGAAAGILIGLRAASSWSPGVDPRIVVADLAVGWLFIGGGLAAWASGRTSIAGLLMIGVGIAWFAGTIWTSFEFLHRGPLFQLLVTYPVGRIAMRGAGHGFWLPVVAITAAYATNATRLGGDPTISTAFGAALLWIGTDGLVRTRGTMRRSRVSAGAAAIALGLVVLAGPIAQLVGTPLGVTALFLYDAILAISALGLAIDLVAGRWSEGTLTRAVVDLGDVALAGGVRDRLARSLGDPALIVAYAVGERPDSFVDELGQPVPLPPPVPGRAITPMVVAGRQTGFIAHDSAVLSDPHLVGALSAAAGLAMSNSTIQAQVRLRVAAVDASRERLVHAADTQRRHLERRLQGGAAWRLERVSELLAQVAPANPAADAMVAAVRADLVRARAELADFARGIHPATLTSGGLGAALAELVRRTPIPVDLALDAEPADPLTEATLYFVCSEALANAAKHAGAATISLDLSQGQGSIRVAVSDDGRGGAQFRSRGGLRGLADRVEALGGTLRLESQPGSGTTLRVELPRRWAETRAVPDRPSTLAASGNRP